MDANFQKIKTFIEASPLVLTDREKFLEALAKVSDIDLAPLVELFGTDPAAIQKVFTNYTAKRLVLDSKKENLWQRIIVEEEKELSGSA